MAEFDRAQQGGWLDVDEAARVVVAALVVAVVRRPGDFPAHLQLRRVEIRFD